MRLRPILVVLFLLLSNALIAETNDSWRLNTEDTVIVVALQNGAPAITLLSSSRSEINWIATPVREDFLASVSAQGSVFPTDWRFADSSFDRAAGTLKLRFVNSSPNLELVSVWRARPGHGPVEHWLTIANHSGETVTVPQQNSLVLHLAIPQHESTSAFWIKRGGGDASTEGGTFMRSVGRNFGQTLVSDPLDGGSSVPWLALQSGNSHGLYAGWEFSGLGRIRAYLPEDGSPHADFGAPAVNIEIGTLPEFKTDLPPGETFVVPAAFVGCYSGDVDDGSYLLHRFVLEKLCPSDRRTRRILRSPTTSTSTAVPFMQTSRACCAARLWHKHWALKPSWSMPCGSRSLETGDGTRRRFPNGVWPLETYIHEHGMKLGQWMAYTHGSDADDPDALNAFQHADWFTKPPKIAPEDTLNWYTRVDLGDDPARAWVTQEAERVIADNRLDFFKTDYTPIETSCERSDHRHHYGVDVSYWSTLGYYRVQEQLLQKFPNVMMEGCSGAGHIKDFGNIQHIHSLAVTDTLSSLPDRQAIYDSTFVLPPATLLTYTNDNHYDRVFDAPEPYLWRSAMMSGWQIAPSNAASWTPAQLQKVKRATEIYKSWIRPILQDCEVHHILPRPDGYHWDGMFYWSASFKRGTLYIFRPDSSQTKQRVVLKGLMASGIYVVKSEDGSTPPATYSGAKLMEQGLDIRLPARYASDLIYLTQSDRK